MVGVTNIVQLDIEWFLDHDSLEFTNKLTFIGFAQALKRSEMNGLLRTSAINFEVVDKCFGEFTIQKVTVLNQNNRDI